MKRKLHVQNQIETITSQLEILVKNIESNQLTAMDVVNHLKGIVNTSKNIEGIIDLEYQD